jgi:hypothetical protein
MQPERILGEMDKDIEAARRKLEQLTVARLQYATAHGLARRSPVSDGAGRADAAPTPSDRTARGRLMAMLLRVMADGKLRTADEVLAAVRGEGGATTVGSVRTALARYASGDNAVLERGHRGMYRVRAEVRAQWANGGAPQGAA